MNFLSHPPVLLLLVLPLIGTTVLGLMMLFQPAMRGHFMRALLFCFGYGVVFLGLTQIGFQQWVGVLLTVGVIITPWLLCLNFLAHYLLGRREVKRLIAMN